MANSFDVKSAKTWVKVQSNKITSDAIGSGVTAAKLIGSGNYQAGVKGTAAVLKMGGTPVFQDGSTCGRQGVTTTSLDNAVITVKPIKDQENICSRTVYNTLWQFAVNKGSDPETEGFSSDFMSYFTKFRTDAVGKAIDELLWQGDSSLTTGNLRFIDGVIKQMGTPTTLAGDDIITKFQNAILAIPAADISKGDVVVFCGNETFLAYNLALAAKNLYNPSAPGKVFGTNVDIIPTVGLDQTGLIFASSLSNMQYGTDGESDAENAKFKYNDNDEVFHFDFYFAVGILVINTSRAVLGRVAASTLPAATTPEDGE